MKDEVNSGNPHDNRITHLSLSNELWAPFHRWTPLVSGSFIEKAGSGHCQSNGAISTQKCEKGGMEVFLHRILAAFNQMWRWYNHLHSPPSPLSPQFEALSLCKPDSLENIFKTWIHGSFYEKISKRHSKNVKLARVCYLRCTWKRSAPQRTQKTESRNLLNITTQCPNVFFVSKNEGIALWIDDIPAKIAPPFSSRLLSLNSALFERPKETQNYSITPHISSY